MEDGGSNRGRRHPGVHPLLPEPGPLHQLLLPRDRLQQIRNFLSGQIGRCCKYFSFLTVLSFMSVDSFKGLRFS